MLILVIYLIFIWSANGGPD